MKSQKEQRKESEGSWKDNGQMSTMPQFNEYEKGLNSDGVNNMILKDSIFVETLESQRKIMKSERRMTEDMKNSY